MVLLKPSQRGVLLLFQQLVGLELFLLLLVKRLGLRGEGQPGGEPGLDVLPLPQTGTDSVHEVLVLPHPLGERVVFAKEQ